MSDSTAFAIWITAIATGGAAVGTVGALILAAKTARSASESAKIANESLQSEARPLLLDMPYEHYTDYEHEYPWPEEAMRKTPMRGPILIDPAFGTFSVRVRNVERGASLVESVSLTLTEVGVTHAEYSGIAIPVGEDAWLSGKPVSREFRDALSTVPSPTRGLMPFIFTVPYTDVVGKQRQQLELGVGSVGQDSALRVKRVKHVPL
ncbi:MAG: hypothetical protein ACLP8S_22410 [Solirubrobacteraceae bacterium]